MHSIFKFKDLSTRGYTVFPLLEAALYLIPPSNTHHTMEWLGEINAFFLMKKTKAILAYQYTF